MQEFSDNQYLNNFLLICLILIIVVIHTLVFIFSNEKLYWAIIDCLSWCIIPLLAIGMNEKENFNKISFQKIKTFLKPHLSTIKKIVKIGMFIRRVIIVLLILILGVFCYGAWFS